MELESRFWTRNGVRLEVLNEGGDNRRLYIVVGTDMRKEDLSDAWAEIKQAREELISQHRPWGGWRGVRAIYAMMKDSGASWSEVAERVNESIYWAVRNDSPEFARLIMWSFDLDMDTQDAILAGEPSHDPRTYPLDKESVRDKLYKPIMGGGKE